MPEVQGVGVVEELGHGETNPMHETWVYPGGLCVLLSHEHGLCSSGPVCQCVIVIWKLKLSDLLVNYLGSRLLKHRF